MLTSFFIILKLITRRGPVKLDEDFAVLSRTLEDLRIIKPERKHRTEGDGLVHGNQNSGRFRRGCLSWRKRAKSGHSPSSATETEL